MKKLKALLIPVLVAVLCLALAACGDGGPGKPADVRPPAPSSGDGAATPAPDNPGEPGVPVPEGFNRVTFYWNGTGDLSACDLWIWWDGKDGSGYPLTPCPYGGTVSVDVPGRLESIGFIVRKNCSDPGGNAWGSAEKDFGEDRFAVITGRETEIYLKSGVGTQYRSPDGGRTLEEIRLFRIAGMTGYRQIKYSITPAARLEAGDVAVYEGDVRLGTEGVDSLGNNVATGVITMKENLDISKNYSVEIKGYGRKPVVPSGIFDGDEFKAEYLYDGDDLGAVPDGGRTTFKVWAPTAGKVTLNLYSAGSGDNLIARIDMTRGERGVWSAAADCGHGTYYTYTVSTSAGVQETQDPYARSAGINGDRSMVVDLSLTNPEGFEDEKYVENIDSYPEAVVWEVHVRDFSNRMEGSGYRGKFLAFTETGLKNSADVPVGLDYLVNLGVTHVHLMPSYDYATVNEADSGPQFNWGYDPENYNVPEGSYSTDPLDGAVRVREFKQMVHALHEKGIGVVMDVVYNHTYAADSSFNKIVPHYYYRYTPDGANTSASGCGNDTASERAMFSKFMVDSVLYWTKEYKVDGFRFDLMGLHDLETMRRIEAAVHAVNPRALLYGEGWTMGSTLDGSPQANQGNIRRIKPSPGAIGGVAVFNDAVRDGLHGGVFNKKAKGYVCGAKSADVLNKVKFGLRGGESTPGVGWSVERGDVVNYMSSHDNLTLWDKLAASNPDSGEEERVSMNRFGASVLAVSKGILFMQAGEEMLRTKNGDGNSYKSPDAVNNLDWESLVPGSPRYETMNFYKTLIAFRKANADIFHDKSLSVSVNTLSDGAMSVEYRTKGNVVAGALINPSSSPVSMVLPEGCTLIFDGTSPVSAPLTGDLTADPLSVCVYRR